MSCFCEFSEMSITPVEFFRVGISTNQANIEANRQNLQSLTDAHRNSILRFHVESTG